MRTELARQISLLTLAVHQELIALQRLLERRTHEGVTRARLCKDSKVHPEEREVDDEWYYNETDSAGHELTVKDIL